VVLFFHNTNGCAVGGGLGRRVDFVCHFCDLEEEEEREMLKIFPSSPIVHFFA
jgi:hypothetical protein